MNEVGLEQTLASHVLVLASLWVSATLVWRRWRHSRYGQFTLACIVLQVVGVYPVALALEFQVPLWAALVAPAVCSPILVWPRPVGRLVITRGAAGCGKTRWAKSWVDEDPTRRFRVGRDDLGAMGHGRRSHDGGPAEAAITIAQENMVRGLLRAGWQVVVDDTNLPQSVVDWFESLARQTGARFEVHDMRHIDEATCLSRNAKRPKAQRVPDDVIKGMFAQYININNQAGAA